jgi:hypothetical protein
MSVLNSVGSGGMLRHFHLWKSRDDRGVCLVLLGTLEEGVYETRDDSGCCSVGLEMI